MKQIKEIVYGLGGYNEDIENNNVVEVIYYTDAELAKLNEAEQLKKQKAALLEKLGITEDEAKLLLS